MAAEGAVSMRFGAGEWLWALWAAPALLALALFALMRSGALVRRFFDPRLLPLMARTSSSPRRAVKWLSLVFAVGLVIFALARPQWGRTDHQMKPMGRDVCFVIDVSRSMLAEDLVPNRLERAKLWVADVLSAARGDRVAIVAFAGGAVVKCPLTLDYGFARIALQDVSTDTVSRGGTLIGDAIRLSLDEVFDTNEPSFKDIILITDGEDHESFPVEAAKKAGEAGVRIITIGVGDETAGRPIPVTDPRTGEKSLLKYKGETVMSKLDGAMLRDVATSSRDGVYFNVSTATIELDSVYKRLIRQAEQKQLEASTGVRYEERFQIFLAAALGLVMIERLISERRT